MSTKAERQRIYYTIRWQRLRDRKLDENPLCEKCAQADITTAATIVHHVRPVRDGGDPFPDLDGLQALCHDCHQGEQSRYRLPGEREEFQKLLQEELTPAS